MGLIAGGIVLYMSCTLAATAGIGGGGLNVPIFYMVFGYSYHTSLKMSLIAVMGNLLSQLFLNYRAHHPEAPSRPLIYWDVVLVLAPALLCGSHAGVVLATILPDTILKALAVVMLTFAAVKTGKKALRIYDKEVTGGEGENKAARMRAVSEQDESLVDERLSQSMRSLSNWNAAEPKLDGVLLADVEMEGENKTALVFPTKVLGVVLALWLVYTCFVTASALCDTCSAEQWVVGFIFFLPFIFAVRASVDLASERQRKDPEMQLDGDVDFSTLGVGPPICTFLIGILCALLGIGGGELAGPLLVSMGLIPQVVAATTSMFSLYGSSATVVGTLVTVKLNPGTSLIAFGLGLLGGLSGRLLAIKVVARLGRPSITVFTLVVCLTLSALAMVYAVTADEVDMHMHDVC